MTETETEKFSGNWNYPTNIVFGVGKITSVPDLCRDVGIVSPLLVCDKGLVNLPFVQRLVSLCKSEKLSLGVYSEVQANPTGANVMEGAQVFKKDRHDGVIALGGGSALDAAKAIALLVGQNRSLWDFEDEGDNWRRVNVKGMAPVIAIPTTSGTGSEVGRASVIIDEKRQKKVVIFHPKMLPATVVCDPELTVGLPPSITAATGMDAFVHCFEAFCAPGFHPMADGIALEGMRLIKENLLLAYRDGADIDARSTMMAASLMGATAFQKGLGGVHALAHPLGAIFDKHHGLLNAILLPFVIRRNFSEIQQKLASLAYYLRLENATAEGFVEWIMAFRGALAIPDTLAEIGIGAERKDEIGVLASQDAAAASNPVSLSVADYAQIFNEAVG
ncbi:alcohol dehydrogenase [Gammaproteobacteria bacterium 45_16_T64]|nr:alcohol dehydrogenase [Gammaproteobacteria bacterium 45_16_T64]